MTNDFSTKHFFSRIIHFWWILAALMILGGVIGFLATFLLKPVYESTAVVSTTLDYAVLGKLDDWEEDQVFRSIGDIITSTEVKDEVLALAQEDGVDLTGPQFDKYFSADRQDTRWVMRVRAESAKTAQRLNTYWSTAVMDALNQLKTDSDSAMVVQQYMFSLADCFEQSVAVEPVAMSCEIQNIDELRAEMAKTGEQGTDKSNRSTFVLSHTSYALTTDPTLPTDSVLYTRNLMVLCGALIGLFLGFVLFSLKWPGLKQEKTS
jgi:hypothetical protein